MMNHFQGYRKQLKEQATSMLSQKEVVNKYSRKKYLSTILFIRKIEQLICPKEALEKTLLD